MLVYNYFISCFVVCLLNFNLRVFKLAKDKIVLNIIDGYKEGDTLVSTNAFSSGLWNSEERTLTIEVAQNESVENILKNVELKSDDSNSKFLSVTYQTSDTTFDLEEYNITTSGSLKKAEGLATEEQASQENINIDKILSANENALNNQVNEAKSGNLPSKEEVLSTKEDTDINLVSSSSYTNIEQADSLISSIDALQDTSFEAGFSNIDTITDIASFFDFEALDIKIKENT